MNSKDRKIEVYDEIDKEVETLVSSLPVNSQEIARDLLWKGVAIASSAICPKTIWNVPDASELKPDSEP